MICYCLINNIKYEIDYRDKIPFYPYDNFIKISRADRYWNIVREVKNNKIMWHTSDFTSFPPLKVIDYCDKLMKNKSFV